MDKEGENNSGITLARARQHGQAKKRIRDEYTTRTKPQAPRMLHCAIIRLYGPGQSAIVALYCKVPNLC